MENIDARKLPDSALEEKRRQAVGLRKTGMTRAAMDEIDSSRGTQPVTGAKQGSAQAKDRCAHAHAATNAVTSFFVRQA